MASIQMTVYGAEVKCASCVNLPSALETKEWLEAAIARKYPEKDIYISYCDIDSPETEEEKQYAEQILDEEYFYPLVVLNGEVVAEGNPRLKVIYDKIEENS
ncbi:YuzD family protein [Bacillus shivajii]|uniref:YuzD family protein n=1 Tax=Bacillus shivajii TaxID=1983719 RepID=UPI001CF9FEDD|nr:YuzD family protein [Bacillus shivajii]UCZ52539.1 YuzD family protein [Bacillus shivajii]